MSTYKQREAGRRKTINPLMNRFHKRRASSVDAVEGKREWVIFAVCNVGLITIFFLLLWVVFRCREAAWELAADDPGRRPTAGAVSGAPHSCAARSGRSQRRTEAGGLRRGLSSPEGGYWYLHWHRRLSSNGECIAAPWGAVHHRLRGC